MFYFVVFARMSVFFPPLPVPHMFPGLSSMHTWYCNHVMVVLGCVGLHLCGVRKDCGLTCVLRPEESYKSVPTFVDPTSVDQVFHPPTEDTKNNLPITWKTAICSSHSCHVRVHILHRTNKDTARAPPPKSGCVHRLTRTFLFCGASQSVSPFKGECLPRERSQ